MQGPRTHESVRPSKRFSRCVGRSRMLRAVACGCLVASTLIVACTREPAPTGDAVRSAAGPRQAVSSAGATADDQRERPALATRGRGQDGAAPRSVARLCDGCASVNGEVVGRWAFVRCYPRDAGAQDGRTVVVGLDAGQTDVQDVNDWVSESRDPGGGLLHMLWWSMSEPPYVMRVLVEEAATTALYELDPGSARPVFWIGVSDLAAASADLLDSPGVIKFDEWAFVDTEVGRRRRSIDPDETVSLALAGLQPAHTALQWRGRERRETCGKEARLDAANTGACNAAFAHVVDDDVYRPHLVTLGRQLRLPFGLWPAQAELRRGFGYQITTVVEDYAVPPVSAYASFGRAAGLGLVRVTVPAGNAVEASGHAAPDPGVLRVFAPLPEGPHVALMTAYWYDPSSDTCVYATIDTYAPAPTSASRSVVRIHTSTPARADAVLVEAAVRDTGAGAGEARVVWPPPPAALWVRLTEQGEVVWIDSAGALWIAGP